MPARQAKFPKGGPIRRKFVGDDRRRYISLLLEQLSHQLERGSLVAFGLDQAVQDLAFSLDRSSKIHLPAADLYKHLVQMPTIIRSWPEASEPLCIAVSELENPTTHSLVADFEAALGQQILDVSEAQRETAIEPYGVLDDLGRESVATIGDLFHRWRLDCCHSTRKPINVTTPLLNCPTYIFLHQNGYMPPNVWGFLSSNSCHRSNEASASLLG